jgi:hypothetical protein
VKDLIAADYRRFAREEARTKSRLYARLAESVAEDDELLSLLEDVPPLKRQPNLLLAVVRYRFGTQDVSALLRTKRTQTKSRAAARRCFPCSRSFGSRSRHQRGDDSEREDP